MLLMDHQIICPIRFLDTHRFIYFNFTIELTLVFSSSHLSTNHFHNPVFSTNSDQIRISS